MNRTDAIAFMIFAGYIVFTTGRGNLRRWLEVIGLRQPMTAKHIATGDVMKGQR